MLSQSHNTYETSLLELLGTLEGLLLTQLGQARVPPAGELHGE